MVRSAKHPVSADPVISVVIPAHNAANWIERAIDCALNQTYQAVEVIAIDDGSTDDTWSIVNKRNADIVVLKNETKSGLGATRNRAIRHASGDIIAFLDADDWWTEDKLAVQANCLQPDSSATWCYTQSWVVDLEGSKLGLLSGLPSRINDQAGFFQWLLFGSFVPSPSSVAIRRKELEAVGLFDERFNLMEDWHLWMKLAHRQDPIVIPQPLTYYQIDHMPLPEVYERYHFAEQAPAILADIFSMFPEVCAQDRDEALAHAYLVGGLVKYAVGDSSSGRSYLQKAFAISPKMLDASTSLASAAAGFYMGMFRHRAATKNEVDALVQLIAVDLASEQTNWPALMTTTVLEAFAYRSFQEGDNASARRYAFEAIRAQPHKSRPNIGILKLLGKTLISSGQGRVRL